MFGQISRRFEDAYPLCGIQVSEADTKIGLDQARDGVVDLVAAYLPLTQPDLTIGPMLSRRERVLLVAADHPLATRDHATVEELGDVTVTVVAGMPVETLDAVVPTRTPSGRLIRRTPLGRASSIVSMVASGRFCHPTVAGFLAAYGYPGIVEVPIGELPPLESALVWATSRESLAIRAFSQIAAEVMTPDRPPESE